VQRTGPQVEPSSIFEQISAIKVLNKTAQIVAQIAKCILLHVYSDCN